MEASPERRAAPIYEYVQLYGTTRSSGFSRLDHLYHIARAHGFQRSGDRIHQAVSKVLDRKYRKTHEDGRAVIWPENSSEGSLVSYRESRPEIRSHADTPIAELASLALPFIRFRLGDEDILYRMANQFQLGRLREPTRIRFQSAIDFARRSLAVKGNVRSK
jgi:hypothetical protein